MIADDLLQEMLGNISDNYQKTIGYPMYDILSAFALSLADTNAQLDRAIAALDPANLSGDDLTRYIYQRRGLVRRAATYATATLEVTGTGTIADGDLFETDGGVQFAAVTDAVIVDSGTIDVMCTTAGSIGNVAANTITKMPITITGIATCTNPEAATDGYDPESDAELLDRFYLSLSEPVMSGNRAHYRQWALEVSGVGDARVYSLARGPNTVDVMIINSVGRAADDALIARVQDYIDPSSLGLGEGKAPIGAHCYVCTAEELQINVAVTVTAGADANRTMIEESMRENLEMYLTKDILMKRDVVSYGKCYAYCAAADGIIDVADDLTLNGGRSSVVIPDRTIAVLGEVTITYA
ncbi:MAG: baseplate J/gp47 family protein [Eubacteriales bacterium]|nr:baseplate J/gp47 family protein [Eubacteriales bacterium]